MNLRKLGFGLIFAAFLPWGCGAPLHSAQSSWDDLRDKASQSDEEIDIIEWYAAELFRPGGLSVEAQKARERLLELQPDGLKAHLLLAIDAEHHGQPSSAVEHYFSALSSARSSDEPDVELYAWYASQQLEDLAGPEFLKDHRSQLQEMVDQPGRLGFRAYADIVELWAFVLSAEAESENIGELLATRLGCSQQMRLAGPFGADDGADIFKPFPAEEPGPWPARFAEEEGALGRPRVLKTAVFGCDVSADEPVLRGVFYSETFLELREEKRLLLTASGATQIWVDDYSVLERDIRQWGVWPRFGTEVRLAPGRHRLLWKSADPSSSLRIMQSDGRSALAEEGVQTTDEINQGYSRTPPLEVRDPNRLMRYIATNDNAPAPISSSFLRYIVASLTLVDGQPDVASVLAAPLIEDGEAATGLSLAFAAELVGADPIYDRSQTRDLQHELEARAVGHDAQLWFPQLKLVVWKASQEGPASAVVPMQELVKQFPEVALVHYQMARLYQNLGWAPELMATVQKLVEQFPEDTDVLQLGIQLATQEGKFELVDKLSKELALLDPDTEIFLTQALQRQDYAQAIVELKKLAERRPERKDIAPRIAEVMARAGDETAAWKRLQSVVEREPRDVHGRLELADAQMAQGREHVLAKALADVVVAGGDPALIEEAIDLVGAMTALEPYRLNALEIIREYESKGRALPGTAARILDYGALWVRSDGSSRFLEHEVVRIQSEEGVKQFTEMSSEGTTLHLRVIKKDGRIFEPEAVAGKATVTMPHLEVGDYVEQERILSQWGDGLGNIYSGPSWFFREPNIAYARSEFVVISPLGKKLEIEAVNGVPAPEVVTGDAFLMHRFRVDDSPASPVEPMSPPAQEFLPRVSVGWGISFDERLRSLSRGVASFLPNDPRIVTIAENIVSAEDATTEVDKARVLYRWVLDSVQKGKEQDGRRVIISRSGSHEQAYVTLCRAVGIPIRWAVAESGIASPTTGPLSRANRPLFPLLVVGSKDDERWLQISTRFAPFGSISSDLIGQKAFLLGGETPQEAVVPPTGVEDTIRYEGEGELARDGSARLALDIVFVGKFAAGLRDGLSQIPPSQLAGIIESRLLGQELQGARLLSHQVKYQDDLDEPLILSLQVEVPGFALPSGNRILLSPNFMPRLSGMTTLARRATPLMIGESNRQSLDLRLRLAPGLVAQPRQSKGAQGGADFFVQDEASSGELHLLREVTTRAGRVAVKDYDAFRAFTALADGDLSSAIRIELSPESVADDRQMAQRP
ncbi:MAG: hypothetical protein MK135_02115 [Polyangiaceae bacterium]|nr:hypothetical protein [Polyangiaceae bacterium]